MTLGWPAGAGSVEDAGGAGWPNCRSGKAGGSLGQIGRDDCVPEFAAAVFGTETFGPEAAARDSPAVLPRLVRHSCVIDGRVIPGRFYVPSSTKVNHATDLATLPRVTAAAEDFPEDVVRTNLQLARDYRRIQNEF